jgi:hypothetical protein
MKEAMKTRKTVFHAEEIHFKYAIFVISARPVVGLIWKKKLQLKKSPN